MPQNRMRRVIRKKQFENIERTCLNYRRSEEKITFQQTRWKSMNENKRLFEPAAILEDVFKNIKHEPLLKRDEFNAFYRHEINSVRGDDKMARLRFGLNHAFQGHPFKALLTGHRGVGKSTELTKLQFMIEEKYYVLRFSVPAELDPVNFRPFDILLLIMIGVAEKTQEILQENNSQKTLPSDLLDDIWNWFSQEKVTHEELNRISSGIEAGAGATGESIWARALGLFAYLRGEIKYSSERKTETVDYRLVRISSLIDLANRLLVKCNQLLQETLNKNWLVICEDFDKSVPIDKVIDFFISNSNILKSLQTHIISTIPVELAYSEQASFLPVPSNCLFNIPDIPVFDQNHKPYRKGQDTIRTIIEARIAPSIFVKGQMKRLITASGGNLQDLFSMIYEAALNATIRHKKSISKEDVTKSINNMRIEYKRRLGESPLDKIPIHFDEKAKRLIDIYNGDRETGITDPILHSLLRARAVQEFNGEGWFGVHPLVVDLLKSFGRLPTDESGRIPGGTN